MRKLIQVFEYQNLSVGEKGFEPIHFEQLAKYKTNTNCKYFELLHNKIRFLNFVGVLGIGDLTIEILPKIDQQTQKKRDKKLWQQVLIDMLCYTLGLSVDTSSYANIAMQKNSVLDVYLQFFLTEVSTILRQGLLKQYRREQKNTTAVKGKLLIQQQIIRNTIHKERFFVESTIYDRNNIYNQILFKALNVVKNISRQSDLSNRCAALLLDFPDCAPINANKKLFDRIDYNRKTEGYRRAINLARMILLNYAPNINNGDNNIIAIMFDMNKLWEKYIETQLNESLDCEVSSQETKKFWQNSQNKKAYLKPDLLISINQENYIIDTKWKHKNEVSPEDLRQMYAYSDYFAAKKTFLLYPFCSDNSEKIKLEKGNFANSDKFCSLLFVDLLNGDKLNPNIGKEILAVIRKSYVNI